jgi:hypothetical protein
MQETTVLTTTEMEDTTVLTTTEMKSSTFLPTTDLLPNGACIELCPCQSVNTYHILSSEELQIRIKELKNQIAVDKKNTNSYKNTKRSLPDSRPSSRNLGIVGVILLIIPLVLMLANDCTRILEHFNHMQYLGVKLRLFTSNEDYVSEWSHRFICRTVFISELTL